MPVARVVLACLAAFVAVLAGLVPPADAAPTWLTPKFISVLGPAADAPQVAVDGRGNVFALWQSSSGGHYRVMSARRPAGGAWTNPVRVSPRGRDAFEPLLAVDRHGNAFAIWHSQDASSIYRIQVARRPAGGSWGTPRTLSAAGQHADDPDIAVNASGVAVAVWVRNDGSVDRIQAARWAGGGWSAPKTVSVGGQNAFSPRVAVDSSGMAVAVWVRYDGLGHGLAQAARQPVTGSWSVPKTLSAAGQDADVPQVAVDGHGNTTVIWERLGDQVVQAARRRHGGSWSPAIDISASGISGGSAEVGADGAGNVFAVWAQPGTTNDLVQVAMRPASGTWEPPFALSVDGVDAAEPQIALNSRGDAVVVWNRGDVVQAARRPKGASWGSPKNLSPGGDAASHAQLAVDGQGNAVAVWQRTAGLQAAAAGLDAAGPIARMVRPRTANQQSRTFTVAWATRDVWSAVVDKDVRYRGKPHGGTFGPWVAWQTNTSASSAPFTGVRGHTYCFEVRGTDSLGNVGAWSAKRCTTIAQS